ncbi:MAG: cell division protein SepF [Lachnospiraceae bacterium]|nr:cell division protein SepF [Lachnospiraceae bacterium]MDY5000777.1 cell division protein SepF [Lachnospiraceae bacterium]
MNFVDTIINGIHVGKDDYDDNEGYLDDPDVEEDMDPGFSGKQSEPDEAPVKRPFAGKPQQRGKKNMSNGMEVCVIKPTGVDDSREIIDTLLSNRTVLLNMEGLDVDIAQRILDYASGATYAIDGNLQKISHYIFIITPASVDVSGDFSTVLNESFDVPQL